MSEQWKHADLASLIGKLAWIIGVICGVIQLIIGIAYGSFTLLGTLYIVPINIFWAIGGVIIIIISLLIIKPQFSDKCANKEWDALYDWALDLGGTKIWWMLIWIVVFIIFGWGYSAGPIIIVFLLLFLAGPENTKWDKNKK
ncbi:MAG: hypothetical protein JXA99_16685 [Candidatus Lokiarchaeota archaeon]|nr:hypothetical protein [Candidatus Lokiarchaeota archaeon]